MNLRDAGLGSVDAGAIFVESHRQIDKWGFQEHSEFKWLAILAEEVGELNQAILQCAYKLAAAEAVSVATLALKIAVMLESEVK